MHSPTIRRSSGATSCAARAGSTSSSPACPRIRASTDPRERENERLSRHRESVARTGGEVAHFREETLALARVHRQEHARRRDARYESLRARLFGAVDDRPPHLMEPWCAGQFLLVVRPMTRKPDDLAELALQRISLVPPVPEQGKSATGTDHAVQVRQSALAVEPVVRLTGEG